jgi:alpha-mannosidase
MLVRCACPSDTPLRSIRPKLCGLARLTGVYLFPDSSVEKPSRRSVATLFGPNDPDLDDLANSVMLVDRDDVQVTALKPAFRGDAVVVRLTSFAPGAVQVRLSCPCRPIRRATLCDARERELRDLEVRSDGVLVPMPYALASVLVWL